MSRALVITILPYHITERQKLSMLTNAVVIIVHCTNHHIAVHGLVLPFLLQAFMCLLEDSARRLFAGDAL